MGLFDKLKKKLGDARDQLTAPPPPAPPAPPYQHSAYGYGHIPPQQEYNGYYADVQHAPYAQHGAHAPQGSYAHAQHAQYPHAHAHAPYPHPDEHAHHAHQAPFEDDHAHLDVAGFDPDDEDAFFHAVLHLESEGPFGGTDESRAEIMARYGIRDRSHWHTVKESVYTLLIARHGSGEEVGQREANWRMGQMQHHMQAQVAKASAGGGFAPVEGVTLEAWAAINAAIAGGASQDDLLKGAGIDAARWHRVSGEWNARMARDTTFAIATTYGDAFQAASRGPYAGYAREAAAARAANRDLAMAPPVTLEQYYELMYEQAYAAKQGQDPAAALRGCGLSIVDWTDLGSFMGYFFHRTAVRHWQEYEAIHRGVQARFAAKHPGVTADVDIQF